MSSSLVNAEYTTKVNKLLWLEPTNTECELG